MQNVVKYLQPKHRRLNGTEADFGGKKKKRETKSWNIMQPQNLTLQETQEVSLSLSQEPKHI